LSDFSLLTTAQETTEMTAMFLLLASGFMNCIQLH